MLYIVRRADYEVEDNENSENPVYIFCNTKTGTLHFRRKSDLLNYGKPIHGVGKDGSVKEIGDNGMLVYIIAQLRLNGILTNFHEASENCFSFYTSQLLVSLKVRKVLDERQYVIYAQFKTRPVRENKDNVLFMPVSLVSNSITMWSWDDFDDSDRQYSRLRLDSFIDINKSGRPSWITDLYFVDAVSKTIPKTVKLFSDLCFVTSYAGAKQQSLRVYICADNINFTYNPRYPVDIAAKQLEVHLVGKDTNFVIDKKALDEKAWRTTEDKNGLRRIYVYSSRLSYDGEDLSEGCGVTWEWCKEDMEHL